MGTIRFRGLDELDWVDFEVTLSIDFKQVVPIVRLHDQTNLAQVQRSNTAASLVELFGRLLVAIGCFEILADRRSKGNLVVNVECTYKDSPDARLGLSWVPWIQGHIQSNVRSDS